MSETNRNNYLTHKDRLLSKANVVGVAVGEDRVEVLVTQKLPLSSLSATDVVDPVLEAYGETASTKVVEVGEIRAMAPMPGASIGRKSGVTGTLGAYVVNEDNEIFVLSNNHVLSEVNKGLALDVIYHPSSVDSPSPKPVAELDQCVPIFMDNRPNYVDAAIARLNLDEEVPKSFRGVLTPRRGWYLSKNGRTSGKNSGQILSMDSTVRVNMGNGQVARFDDQVLSTPMLHPGDSGSVAATSGGYACLLGFAGSDSVSIWTPLHRVLNRFGVSLI